METVLIALPTIYTNYGVDPAVLYLTAVDVASLRTRWAEWQNGSQSLKAGVLVVGTR